jgi:hypothetical protein
LKNYRHNLNKLLFLILKNLKKSIIADLYLA